MAVDPLSIPSSSTNSESVNNDQQKNQRGLQNSGDQQATNDESNLDNMSGLLSQLLSMSKSLFEKTNGENCICCQFGHKNNAGMLKSPATNKNLAGCSSKSPSTVRSPRNQSLKSPKTVQNTGSSKIQNLSKNNQDKKPSSAKKLIPDTTDQSNADTIQRQNERNNPKDTKRQEESEFRVPIAPAPKALPVQQANFNAQISVSK